MTLLDAPKYDPARDIKRRNFLIGAAVTVVVLAFLTFWFWNWPAEHRVNRFFTAIEAKDMAKAYGIWNNDEDWQKHPEKHSEYPVKRFQEDWTKYSPVGPIHSHHVDKSISDGSGSFGTTLLVATTINGDKNRRVFLGVQRSDGTFSYPAPHIFEY